MPTGTPTDADVWVSALRRYPFNYRFGSGSVLFMFMSPRVQTSVVIVQHPEINCILFSANVEWCVFIDFSYVESAVIYGGWLGCSNRPLLSRLAGPISRDITRNSGSLQVEPPLPSEDLWAPPHFTLSFPLLLFVTLSLAPFSFPYPYLSPLTGKVLTYVNIWRVGPPGRRTNRPNWQVPVSQEAQSASGHVYQKCAVYVVHLLPVFSFKAIFFC